MNISVVAIRDLKDDDFNTIKAVTSVLRRFDRFTVLPISAMIEFSFLEEEKKFPVARITFYWHEEIFESFLYYYAVKCLYHGEGFKNLVHSVGIQESIWGIGNAVVDAFRDFLDRKMNLI